MPISKIYALIDPRNNQINYIGCSKYTHTGYRLEQHILVSNRPNRLYHTRVQVWIRELTQLGIKPIMQEIDIDGKTAYENTWISFFYLNKYPIKNKLCLRPYDYWFTEKKLKKLNKIFVKCHSVMNKLKWFEKCQLRKDVILIDINKEVKVGSRRLKNKDIAKILKCSESYVSFFLRGKKRITLDLSKKLSDAFGRTPAYWQAIGIEKIRAAIEQSNARGGK